MAPIVSAKNKVDVYDGKFNHVKPFTDRVIAAGFTVFGVRDLDGLLYVSYARSNGGNAASSTSTAKAGCSLKPWRSARR